MDFKGYCEILKAEALEFREGKEWDIDRWNESYIDFKEGMAAFNEDYVKSLTPEQHALEWAREYYQEAHRDTHDYWVVKKNNGWYCAETTKPEYNRGVLVLIPAESNHVTAGFWDISKKWVLTDEYRTVPAEKEEIVDGEPLAPSIVTWWTHTPALPILEE